MLQFGEEQSDFAKRPKAYPRRQNRVQRHDASNEKRSAVRRTLIITGGDDGDRTHDLNIANVALSQLSYIPSGY